ncbi:alpha/beta hydrolase [Lysinibacillus sp. 3P01SB]|uniref:alpha/beta hydrolase n=1 Tax=Lysinibacillus sp. 3P01SB TaxID=3132284 RepID=UPI0039A653C8
MKKKLTIILGIVIVLLIGAYFAVGNYFYNFALNADDEKEFLEGNEHLEDSLLIDEQLEAEATAADEAFLVEHKMETISITSNDELKLKLAGYVYEQESKVSEWVMVAHGYTSSAEGMTRYIRHFYEQGYNVLAVDLRGHGNSEGDYIGMGWHDRLDMVEWIDEVIQRDAQAEIALFGISMGGATVMMTAGEELPDNVKVIVEDCGYASVSDVFIYQLDDLFGLPEFPVIQAANTVTKIRAGYDLYEASAVEQLKKSELPILFIHGDKDTFVPFEMLDDVYNAAAGEKEQLIIEGAGHGEAVKVKPDVYWQAVDRFMGEYL